MAEGALRIGTSGYQYDHWRGPFYPEDLPKAHWFDHYCGRFDTVEVNNTFYHLPDADTFVRWREAAPPGFCYALKYSRYGTHMKRLKDPEAHLGRFLEAARGLGATLGPILVQLPPRWRANPQRLAAFLDAAPGDCRWAVEVRDGRWLCDEVFTVLEGHGAALCIHDMLPDHPRRLTADWVYLRFHGDHYQGSYSSEFLAARAEEIRADLAAGRDVYAYFNNDEAGHAVRNAAELKALLEG